MYCRKCGAENADHAKFCGKCGAELVQIPQESTQEEKSAEKKVEENLQKDFEAGGDREFSGDRTREKTGGRTAGDEEAQKFSDCCGSGNQCSSDRWSDDRCLFRDER